MNKMFLVLFTALAVVIMSVPATASPVFYTLTLNQTSPSATTITGTFSIDDSLLLPNTFIAFSNILSFTITAEGRTWTVADKFSPTVEGVLTNAAGEISMFDDPFGNFTEFCDSSSFCTQFLRFHDGTFDYDTFVSSGTAGTYSISKSSVPEPASILLLGGSLVGVATLRKRYF